MDLERGGGARCGATTAEGQTLPSRRPERLQAAGDVDLAGPNHVAPRNIFLFEESRLIRELVPVLLERRRVGRGLELVTYLVGAKRTASDVIAVLEHQRDQAGHIRRRGTGPVHTRRLRPPRRR